MSHVGNNVGSKRTYEVDNDDPRPPPPVLSMYPYPSGPAHGYVATTPWRPPRSLPHNAGRRRSITHRIRLFRITTSETTAIKTGTHPPNTQIKTSKLYLHLYAVSAQHTTGDKVVRSHDPEYMKWTQWIFSG